MAPVREGTTSEVDDHVHTYYVNAAGHGVADYAYPPLNASLRHQHEIVGYVVQPAYSPAAKKTHSHRLEYEEDLESLEGTDLGAWARSNSLLEGGIGLRHGLRLCYIPSMELVEAIESGANLESMDEQLKLQKAFNFQDSSATLETALATLNTILQYTDTSFSLKPFKYMFPIASAEVDVLDQTLAELADNITSGYNTECMIDLLMDSANFRTMFDVVAPLTKSTSLMAIYTTKAFLPSIGQDTGDSPETGDGEWAKYSKRRTLGRQSPYDRWDQNMFRRLKKTLRNVFLSNYNVGDPEYSNPDKDRESLRFNLTLDFHRPALDIPMSWFKRRRIIGRPFNKLDDECD